MTTDALYQKATDAVERQNYDYAIELLMQLVTNEPTNVKARQTLWLAEKRKFGDKGPSKSTAFLQTMGPRLNAAIHGMTGKPLKIIEDCERCLQVNPYDVAMRNKLAKAAYEAGDRQTAIAAYESAREVDPKDFMALRQLGRLYHERFKDTQNLDDLNLAMDRFEELQRAKPSDHEARSTGQQLAAHRAVIQGGWQTAEGASDVTRDKDSQQQLQDDQRLVRTEDDADRQFTELAERIKKEPDRANLYVRLGDLYLHKKRFKSAEEAFKKAHELEPTSTMNRARLGEVKIQFMQTQIAQLEEKLQTTPDDAPVRAQLEDARGKLSDFTTREFRQRVHDQPTNMEVHSRLGMILFERGEFDEAMAMFQKSVADPRYRMNSNHMLGRCLVAKEMYDRAINMFKRAVDGVIVINQLVKGVYYDLGETYERTGNYVEAEHAYGKIYDSDVGYRDIAQKMETLYRKAREQEGKK